MKKIGKTILIVLAVFVVFLFILGSIGSSSGTANNINETQNTIVETNNVEIEEIEVENVPEITTDVTTIQNEFESNGLRAQATYSDKLVEVSGVVGDIDKDVLGTPYVMVHDITDEFQFNGIQCFLDKDNQTIYDFTKGDPITVNGYISDEFIINILMDDCNIVL